MRGLTHGLCVVVSMFLTLLSYDLSALTTARRSALHIDSNGNAVALWQDFDPGSNHYMIQSATLLYPGASGWSGPQTLSTTVQSVVEPSPQLKLNANGNGAAIWRVFDPTLNKYRIQASIYDGNTALWGTAATLSDSNEQVTSNMDLRINDSDLIIVSWDAHIGSSTASVIRFANANVGGSWSTAATISP